MCVLDALGTTDRGEVFATKWPRRYGRVVPSLDRGQSIQETFSWPAKVRANLEQLKSELEREEKPALLSEATFRVTSNFSGICSASRGAHILEAHQFGCRFEHVQFSASAFVFL